MAKWFHLRLTLKTSFRSAGPDRLHARKRRHQRYSAGVYIRHGCHESRAGARLDNSTKPSDDVNNKVTHRIYNTYICLILVLIMIVEIDEKCSINYGC